MLTLPVIAHPDPDAAIAWRAGRLIGAGQFLASAASLADQLPSASPVLNLCTDRYCFAVAIVAALLRGHCSLLPATQLPQTLRHLQSQYPGLYGLVDDDDGEQLLGGLGCQAIRADAHLAVAGNTSSWPAPRISATQPAVILFTSGSTGTPMPHQKAFGNLVRCVRAEAERLSAVRAGGCTILATVPAQHSYGFESTVLLPLQSAGLLCAARPLFPADIAATLARLPRPRLLCTTPVHLRALLDTTIELPPLDGLLCATAPLSEELARAAERRYGAALVEIYGSTETGQMASRRTVTEQAWHLWPEVQLREQAPGFVACGGHLGQPTAVADVLEPLDAEHFLLHGRSADLVNVAGKRSSLAYLSYQLTNLPGVVDGAFFVREEARASVVGITRLAALAVTPQLDAATILAGLRERIDPVFLPRPLLLVERLPRNGSGKLPQQALQQLAAQLAAASPHLFR